MPPHSEDFARWREDRVTQWVFAALSAMSDANRASWIEASWENGIANERVLTELRTRADAYRAMFETDYAAFCDANGDEPNVV
jgi:hypothetical protein